MTAPVLPDTMTAWRQSRYGSPDVVARSVVPVPRPRKGQVLLRMRATGLNSADIRIMRGQPRLVRLAFGLSRPRIVTQGRDVAGTVVAVGDAVAQWRIGDEVVGEIAGGGLAEYVLAPAGRVVRRPEAVDPVTAAAVPLAGGTAVQALDAAAVASGSRVLVLGAAGGVGTFAVQLAALRGAEVWAFCGRRAESLVRGLGAAHTFDYRTVELTSLADAAFDAIIDVVGTASVDDLQRLLRPPGTAVLVGSAGNPFPRMLRALMRSRKERRIRPPAAVPRPAITADLLEKTAERHLRPAIQRTWPLDHAGAALAHVDAGHTVGKVVVVADPPPVAS
jgi:NADPH:quinone reductase-like Zn-dependent oxidoreductase